MDQPKDKLPQEKNKGEKVMLKIFISGLVIAALEAFTLIINLPKLEVNEKIKVTAETILLIATAIVIVTILRKIQSSKNLSKEQQLIGGIFALTIGASTLITIIITRRFL